MRKIIHIIADDKFFDKLLPYWEQIDNYENIFVFFTETIDYKFHTIKNIDRLTIIKSISDLKLMFSSKDIHLIYFHSLDPRFYQMFDYIDKKTIVAVWFWGFELYFPTLGGTLIDLKLFKPLTRRYTLSIYKRFKFCIKRFLYHRKYQNELHRIFGRFDYCRTVLPIEYELLQKYDFFKAKPFIVPRLRADNVVTSKKKTGHIFLGNSGAPTGNHLDVLRVLNKINLNKDQNIIIPLSYGDKKYIDLVKRKAVFFSKMNIVIIDKFMPLEEYSKLQDSSTHAIFGNIRQQAMGNIYYCLQNAIKVFLYKKSIVYKQLKEIDKYIVYSIEDDLSERSLTEVLSPEDASHNLNIFNLRSYSKAEYAKELQNTLDSLKK